MSSRCGSDTKAVVSLLPQNGLPMIKVGMPFVPSSKTSGEKAHRSLSSLFTRRYHSFPGKYSSPGGTGRSSLNTFQKRHISYKFRFESMKNPTEELIRKTVRWFKKFAVVVMFVLKSILSYQVEVLLKGFKDKAVALHFCGLVLAGYKVFCLFIDKFESKLIELDNRGNDNESEIAKSARKMALMVIGGIKAILMVFSSGEMDQLKQKVDVLEKQMMHVLKTTAELTVDDSKLKNQIKVLESRISEQEAKVSKEP